MFQIPGHKDLLNHIALSISAQKYSNADQESFRHKINDWRQRNPLLKYYYRERSDVSHPNDATE